MGHPARRHRVPHVQRTWATQPGVLRGLPDGGWGCCRFAGESVVSLSTLHEPGLRIELRGQNPEDTAVASIEEIEEKVISIVAEQLSVDKAEISRETSFVSDLGADSLDTVELVMELEDEFDMNIPDEEAEKIQTVGAAIEFIQKQMAAAK